MMGKFDSRKHMLKDIMHVPDNLKGKARDEYTSKIAQDSEKVKLAEEMLELR